MAMRASSLQATNTLAINREIDSKYDAVLQVRYKLPEIEIVAGMDIEALLIELEAAQDFTGISVVQGAEVAWDPIGKVLTVPKGDKGDTGEQGLQGVQGIQGIAGPRGAEGPKGDQGATGAQGPIGFTGPQGPQGIAGVDGQDLTVEQIVYNGNGTFTWQFSDGTSYVTPNLRGPQGATGSKGEKGDTGTSVNHIKGTSTTDSEGNFGSEGETDTYTMYADVEEQFVLGWFVIKNGSSPYTLAVAEGYSGTKEDFYNELTNVRTYAELAESSAISADADATQVAADKVVVENARDVTVAAKDLTVTSADVVQTIFLGAKNVDPTVDNQGDPLVPGVMYYNDVLGTLKIWTGTEWTMAAFSADGAVFSFNGRDGFVTLTNADITAAVGKSLTDAIKYSEADKVLTDVNKLNLSTDTNLVAGVGQMTWNPDENTVDVGLNGATLQIGQEQLIRVRNSTASPIVNGSAVMATGTIGNSGRITVGPAQITNANARYVLGVVTETIAAGADGFCTTFGKVRGIDTSGSVSGETWVDGDVLYVKDSGNGLLTKVVPTDTQVKLPIAIVVSAHATTGTLFVRTTPVDENHDKAELATKITRPVSTTHKVVKFTDTNGSIGDSNLVSNSMGDLGLNVSPSLWHTSVRALETASGSVFNYSTTRLGAIQNAYQGLDGIYRYKSNAPATLLVEEGGEFKFSTAPSGVTEASVTFTERVKIANDGTLTVNGNVIPTTADADKNVLSATKLATARTISLTGDVAGNVSFDGSANVSITATVADDSHNHVISNVDGLQVALDNKVDKVSKQSLDSNSALRVSGTTVSLYKGDGTFDSITTQDTIYTLPTATSTVKGGIGIFSDTVQTVASNTVSTTAGRTYGIQLNSAGQAVVNVPWSDTNTVYTHPNSGVTAGTYPKVTVNAQGHITTGASLSASDIPSLDASKITSGTIDPARLPSFVDDVLEFANLAGFPATGETGKIYIALDTNKSYRWSGSTYVYITSGAVDSVAGKTGVVTLVKADVGLTNVDNTSDLNKPISTATQTALNSKVDKVSGKQLSTEDYTTAEKTKLSGIAAGAQVNVPTDLSLGTATSTTLPLNSSTGTDVVLPAVTTTTAGLMSSTDKTKLDGVSSGANNYVLPTATSTVKGGIEIFSDTVQTVAASAVSSTANRTYGIQLNAAGQAVVNVPWVDTNTTTTVENVLTSTSTTNALSAAQGKALNDTKANLNSPTFTGVPSAPTATVGTNTTQLATTAFVMAEINKIEEW